MYCILWKVNNPRTLEGNYPCVVQWKQIHVLPGIAGTCKSHVTYMYMYMMYMYMMYIVLKRFHALHVCTVYTFQNSFPPPRLEVHYVLHMQLNWRISKESRPNISQFDKQIKVPKWQSGNEGNTCEPYIIQRFCFWQKPYIVFCKTSSTRQTNIVRTALTCTCTYMYMCMYVGLYSHI